VKIDPQTVMGGSFGPSFVFEKARFGGPFLLRRFARPRTFGARV
jgi:hypothetical protein